MGNVGRVFCVALPFALTIASLIALLVAGLAGVGDKSLYLFQIDTTNLSVNPLDPSLTNIINGRSLEARADWHDLHLLDHSKQAQDVSAEDASAAGVKVSNVTAKDLGLANLYDVALWGYCSTGQDGERSCIKTSYNWAENEVNKSKAIADKIADATVGTNITIPEDLQNALDAFSTLTRWTEIVFVIAFICLGVELLFGIFANCTRVMSCLTFLVAAITTVAVGAAAGLSTAMATVVVGVIEGTAKVYGVHASFNNKFLAAVWIATAFALAAAMFWLFTICCCKPDHSRRQRNRGHEDGEKMSGAYSNGAYQPIHDNTGYYPSQPTQQYGAPHFASGGGREQAYEPFSHARV